MCDFFWQRMENNQGDLADIVRASRRAADGSQKTDVSVSEDNWQFMPSEPLNFFSPASDHVQREDFIDPFSNLMRDPFFNELSVSSFLESHDHSLAKPTNMLNEDIIVSRPSSNVYSKMFQISPGSSKPSPSPIIIGGSPADHLGVQISSSQSPTIKRRKNQAKRVVCIPAPAAVSNRPSGEVIPSDLWAWRKYGQKPIKGSPYPSGYYRCSSSKGCSARKQVERSRTDPNMLVITYTSEHNHPWPTQRNALAGSTRAQPSKNSLSLMKNNPDNSTPESLISSSAPSFIKDEVFNENYKPMIQESADDFFADLAELESDPMRLIFSKDQLNDHDEEDQINKEAIADNDDDDDDDNDNDPFSMLDSWGGGN
ncbi:WRKY domain-containing protein [Dioscorea alata]|nr:WRKY domain-containing protein [Dioscorea alata]